MLLRYTVFLKERANRVISCVSKTLIDLEMKIFESQTLFWSPQFKFNLNWGDQKSVCDSKIFISNYLIGRNYSFVPSNSVCGDQTLLVPPKIIQIQLININGGHAKAFCIQNR